jgi:hypothetical protein
MPVLVNVSLADLPLLPTWVAEAAAPPPRQLSATPPPPTVMAGEDRARRYGLGAIRSAVQRVATEPQGGRNRRLNAEAYGLARLVATGAISAGEIIEALVAAAVEAGLPASRAAVAVRSALLARGVP